MNECLVDDGHIYNRIQLIQNFDLDAGFWAMVTYALNGVRRSIKNNRLPVVNFNKSGARYFYDPEFGDNVWEYYFLPIMGVRYADVKRLLNTGRIHPDMIHSDKPGDVLEWHTSDPERIATFWAKDIPRDRAAWMAEKRALGREYVAKYIHVKKHISSKVEGFADEHIKPQYTIGVHIRGTDFAYAEPTKPADYFQEIHELARQHQMADFKIFLATDQSQYVELFRQEFNSKIITYPSLRSSSDVAPFKLRGVSPYQKGEDVLVDTLLLSKCNYLLKCAAAGGEFALWFNSSLACSDFALESRYSPRRLKPITNAYLKLNVGHAGPIKLPILRLYSLGMHSIRRIRIRLWLFKSVCIDNLSNLAHGLRRSRAGNGDSK